MGIILALVLVVTLMVIASSKYHVHPFLSLLVAAISMGFIGGLDQGEIINTLIKGFGSTLGSIGIIIALGCIIGAYLQKSGGANSLAHFVLKIISEQKSLLAMNLTGFVVSISVFCDSGFIVLSSIMKAISKRAKISLIALGVATAAGLYATHVFVPPTPGPLAAAAALDADLGLVMVLGLIVAIPVSLVGFFWASYINKQEQNDQIEAPKEETNLKDLPKPSLSFAPIFIPILLIALRSVSQYPTQPLGEGIIVSLFDFLGNPVIALFIGVLLAFTLKPKKIEETHSHWVSDGLAQAGSIILITGVGGAFGAILRDTGIGEIIGTQISDLRIGLLLPFVIAAILKSAQGSSTVSIITTAAIIAPLLDSLGLDSSMGRALAVLAIGAGAMTVSHINDSYFWVVSQFSGMSTTTALKRQTVSTLFQGLTGIIIVTVIGFIFL